MTKKEQIIIDGVDVSKCVLFENADNEMGCALTCCGGCKGKDCDYKQLQRKTAECEELKKEIEENRWLKIEMDRIRKKELKTSELVDDFDKINQSLSEENNTLKAGLEKLKAQKETYQKMLNDPEVKAALIDVQTGEREVWHKLGNRAKRYKQALDEIEKILDNGTKDTQTNNAKWLQQHYLARFCEIRDIINKAKGERIKEYLNGTALLHTLYDGEEISKEIIKCRVEIIPNSTARFLYTNSLIKENDVIIHNKIRYAVTKVIPYLVGGVRY